MDNLYERFKNFATSTYESVRKPQDGWSLILLLVTIAITIWVIVYVFNEYNTSNLVTTTLLKDPFKVGNDVVTNVTENKALPAAKNGNEFSVSFWTFVENETSDSTIGPKLILGFMDSALNSGTSSPLFKMESGTNEFTVQLLSVTEREQHIIKGGYLPMQRWVNITLVIENNFIQLYVDGELRNVQDVDQTVKISGNIYIGGTAGVVAESGATVNAAITHSINGYISKIQAFNYALTIDHVKIVYRKGPLASNILSKIGIPMYGIRNPFYDITTVDSCSS